AQPATALISGRNATVRRATHDTASSRVVPPIGTPDSLEKQTWEPFFPPAWAFFHLFLFQFWTFQLPELNFAVGTPVGQLDVITGTGNGIDCRGVLIEHPPYLCQDRPAIASWSG